MTSSLGSDLWTNEPRYQDDYRSRIDFVLSKVPSAALQQLAASLRGGLSCVVSDNFSAGNYNLVKKVTFVDNVQWVVRIRLPPLSYFSGAPPHASVGVECTDGEIEALRSEVATMQYVQQNTSIPIPTIHSYSFQQDLQSNPLGLPYIMMDYVHGSTAFALSSVAGNPLAIPTKFADHYYTQIAKIMVELASLRFEHIGSLTADTNSPLDKVSIGPIAETSLGPYETAEMFYSQYPAALARALYDGDATAAHSGGAETIRRLPGILSAAKQASTLQETTFGLTNLELGTHNVLVNGSFDVLAVIDWDSVIAAPSAVLHQFPWCIGGDPGIPGIGSIKAFGDWDGRIELCRQFAQAAESAANLEARSKNRGNKLLGSKGFFSKEALAFRSLAFFRVKQNWVDEQWVPGLNWLERCSDRELLEWYGMDTHQDQ